jgi:hypothetical protein
VSVLTGFTWITGLRSAESVILAVKRVIKVGEMVVRRVLGITGLDFWGLGSVFVKKGILRKMGGNVKFVGKVVTGVGMNWKGVAWRVGVGGTWMGEW